MKQCIFLLIVELGWKSYSSSSSSIESYSQGVKWLLLVRIFLCLTNQYDKGFISSVDEWFERPREPELWLLKSLDLGYSASSDECSSSMVSPTFPKYLLPSADSKSSGSNLSINFAKSKFRYLFLNENCELLELSEK